MTLLRRANVHGRRTTPGDRVVVGRVEVLVAHGEGGVLVVRTLAPRLGRLRGSEAGRGGKARVSDAAIRTRRHAVN